MANGLNDGRCRVCGQDFQYTNWQIRLARAEDERVHKTTVHEAKCKGLTLMGARESRAWRWANLEFYRRRLP